MRFTLQQETQGWSTGMQHNFIETLEATSIYKQGNGSLLNVNAFFWSQNYRKEQGKKTKQKNNSQGLDQWQVYFLNTKKIKKKT